MKSIIQEVYKVFGKDLPASRSAYSAHMSKPFPVLTITKAFKDWKSFAAEYTKYAIAERNTAAKAIVTKKVNKDV